MENKNRERGSTLVELSLIILVVLSLLIGSIDFGQFLYIHQALTERARSAVRYGVTTSPLDTAGTQNMVLYGSSTAGSTPDFGLIASNVVVTTSGAGTDDYRLSVQVKNYRYTIYSPFIAGTYTGPNILAELPVGANYQ